MVKLMQPLGLSTLWQHWQAAQWRHYCDKLVPYFVLVGIFFIPVSPSLTAMITVAMVFALFGHQLWDNAKLVWQYPFIYPLTAFIILLAIGVVVNDYNTGTALHNFLKYWHKLLILFVLIPFFFDAVWRRRALNVLILAAVVYALMISGHQWNLYNLHRLLGQHYTHIISGIPFAVFVSFSCYVLTLRILDESRLRLFYTALLLFLLYFLLAINIQRAAYGLLVALTFLLFIQKAGLRGFLFSMLIVPCLIALAFFGSEQVELRIKQVVADVVRYDQNKQATSVGLRLEFIKKSAKLIKQRPLLGHGTGAFAAAYHTTGGLYMPGENTLGDPHNVFASLGVQLGLLGLGVFMVWLLVMINDSFKLPKPEQFICQALLISFIVAGAFFEDSLLRSKIAHLVLVFLAILFAARHSDKHKEMA